MNDWPTPAGDPPGQWGAASDSGRSAASLSYWRGCWCRFPLEPVGPERRVGPLPLGVKKWRPDIPVTEMKIQLIICLLLCSHLGWSNVHCAFWNKTVCDCKDRRFAFNCVGLLEGNTRLANILTLAGSMLNRKETKREIQCPLLFTLLLWTQVKRKGESPRRFKTFLLWRKNPTFAFDLIVVKVGVRELVHCFIFFGNYEHVNNNQRKYVE